MKSNPLLFLFLIIVFITGLYVYSTKQLDSFVLKESMETMDNETLTPSCPTILIKEGNVLLLYNPKEPQSDKNPLSFDNIEDYVKHLETEKKKGVNCPVLFLQKENDIQGNDVYRIRPGPDDLQGGLSYSPNHLTQQMEKPIPIVDSSIDMPPYNQGTYTGFDPMGLHVGQYTELDKIHDSTKESKVSPNPLDSNWGGVQYTQKLIDEGVYDENNVSPPRLIEARKLAFF
jgi:hypothetical protein